MIHWSNASLTIWCLFCWTICLWPQNTPQFLISLLHWSQISFPGAFSWRLQTASSHWGPDQENRVGAEAIQSAVHVVLPSLQLICDKVHCLGERTFFSTSFVVIFWWFLPSNAPIMLWNIRYWWFFLSQGNRGTKYLAHPKIRRPKPCLLMFASLVSFGRLSPAAVYSTDCWSEVLDPCFIHCHIFMQKLLFVALKLLQTTFWIVDVLLFLIDCEQMFMQNGEYTAFWYLQLLCYLTQLQCMIGQNEFVEFFGVFKDNCRIWVTWAFSIICICMTMFKFSIPPLNYCFQQTRVPITLMRYIR